MRLIEWLAGANGGWERIALAVALAVLVAYGLAALAVRVACSALLAFAFADTTTDRRQQWQRPLRAARGVIFLLVLAALLLPALDLAGAGVPMQAGRGVLLAWFVGSGLRILVIVLLSVLLVRVIASSTARLEAQVMIGGGPDRVEHVKRARTLSRLVKNALTSLVLGVGLLMILRELNVDIMPVLTGAGIVGLAVGFGAQTLVKDLISGAFLILDDNVRVGDVARINGTGGLVEAINLRTIVLRDHEGTVHVFPNGSITTLSNLTKDFAFAVVDVGFNFSEDPDRVAEVLRRVATEVAEDPAFVPKVLAPPEIQVVEAFGNGQMTIRVRIKARPLTQWDIGRELRRRIGKAFDEEGIRVPPPPGTVTLLPASAVPIAATVTPAAEPTDGSGPDGPQA